MPILLPVVALMAWKANAGRDAVSPVDWAVTSGASIAALAVFAVSVSAWGTFTAARVLPWLAGQAPWKLMDFLEAAHRHGILRQSGAYYQFRHARLQERLAIRAAAQPFPTPPAPAQRPRRPLLAAVGTRAGMAGFALGALAFLAVFTVLSIALSDGPPGPHVLIRPACELLGRKALTTVLPEPDIVSQPDGGDKCWWANERPIPIEADVILEARVFVPDLGASAVQHAEKRLQTQVQGRLEKHDPLLSINVVKPQYTGYPEGLGDEAFTVIYFGDSGMPETALIVNNVVRVDNVILIITYMVRALEEDKTLSHLARSAENLARVAVSNLGP
ncbi:hypothetical protein [Streptomyces sp. NPDC056987]|uniref:hypothetical protein n=1 Tax=Streptomyces sp. NPDC056987 TaxID=3345988 RepID=UPI0036436E24